MVRKAGISDLDVAMQLIAHSRQIMRSNGNASQWTNGYPKRETLLEDIRNGNFYCICDHGEVVGCFSFIIGEDPTYNKIEKGAWTNDILPYGTIHRLACAPGSHNIAQQCIAWCEQQVDSLRADTHADNSIMQHILERHNFRYCGIIHVADGSPRKAYQKLLYHDIPLTLRKYVEEQILPRYDKFDSAHSREHILSVIDNCMELSQHYPIDRSMIYVVAAYHDLGVGESRALHHILSGKIIREDTNLDAWFSPEEIATIAEAAEDHRASTDREPRSIYGKIVAEADRDIDKEKIVRRTIAYGIAHYPTLDKAGLWDRTLQHLHEKYAAGGYLKLWLPDSPNKERLEDLRALIADETKLREMFEEICGEIEMG